MITEHLLKKSVVRVISVIKVDIMNSVRYCQIWFPNEKKVIISNISSVITKIVKKYFTTYFNL